MPKLHEVGAAGITLAGGGKNLFRLHIKEAKPHGAMSHDTFQVPSPPAAAEMLLGIQGHDGMPSFPDAFRPRIASETDPFTQGPDSNNPVEMPAGGRNSCRHHIGIVENTDRHLSVVVLQRRRQGQLKVQSLHLLQIGRVLDDSAPNNAGETHADGRYVAALADKLDLLPYALGD